MSLKRQYLILLPLFLVLGTYGYILYDLPFNPDASDANYFLWRVSLIKAQLQNSGFIDSLLYIISENYVDQKQTVFTLLGTIFYFLTPNFLGHYWKLMSVISILSCLFGIYKISEVINHEKKYILFSILIFSPFLSFTIGYSTELLYFPLFLILTYYNIKIYKKTLTQQEVRKVTCLNILYLLTRPILGLAIIIPQYLILLFSQDKKQIKKFFKYFLISSLIIPIITLLPIKYIHFNKRYYLIYILLFIFLKKLRKHLSKSEKFLYVILNSYPIWLFFVLLNINAFIIWLKGGLVPMGNEGMMNNLSWLSTIVNLGKNLYLPFFISFPLLLISLFKKKRNLLEKQDKLLIFSSLFVILLFTLGKPRDPRYYAPAFLLIALYSFNIILKNFNSKVLIFVLFIFSLIPWGITFRDKVFCENEGHPYAMELPLTPRCGLEYANIDYQGIAQKLYKSIVDKEWPFYYIISFNLFIDPDGNHKPIYFPFGSPFIIDIFLKDINPNKTFTVWNLDLLNSPFDKKQVIEVYEKVRRFWFIYSQKDNLHDENLAKKNMSNFFKQEIGLKINESRFELITELTCNKNCHYLYKVTTQ
jgi:hypothetical protein